MKGKKLIECTMFYGAKPDIFQKAKELRNNETKAEKILWEHLKQNKIPGFKFRRQHPIDIFIVDFYCHKLKLVIEVDGVIHDKEEIKKYDEGRTAELEECGLKILRFSNEEIFNDIENVLNKIYELCNKQERGLPL